MKIKLCVVSVGVQLEAGALSIIHDVSGAQNKEQRSKNASWWYATENDQMDLALAKLTDCVLFLTNKWTQSNI